MSNIRGTPSTITFSGGSAGSTKSFTVVQGSTGDGIDLGNPRMGGSTFTWFSIARYAGNSKGRIFTSSNSNEFTGFWSGQSGVSYRDNTFITSSTGRNGDNWFVWMDQGYRIRSNGEDIQTRSDPYSLPPMCINCADENSDWQVAEVIIFNSNLQSFGGIEYYLGFKYGITFYLNSESAKCAASDRNSVSFNGFCWCSKTFYGSSGIAPCSSCPLGSTSTDIGNFTTHFANIL